MILNDKFDVWQVAADGSRATRLTDGAAEQIRHRVVRLNPDDEWIDTSKPLHVSLFAPWTKRSGYVRVDPASSRTERLIWLDKSIGAIAKAKEDLQAYIRNSAVYGVATMKTPLMVAFGDNDGTVHWHQGVELYNIARRAKKDVVMLVYTGEDHGLRKKPNQVDYQHRILQWFGHYLKSEPPRPWITSGVSFLEREQELKRLKTKKGTT